LVHISQLSNRFVKDPRDVVSPGDRVTVRVLEVNLDKNQIALTMKSEVKSDAEAVRNKPSDRQAAPNRDRKPNRDRDQKRRDDQKRPPRPEKTAFNNPFAQLANWGKDDK
jgi:uncharacterized protein